ncbi:Quinate repressor protein [Cytospora mali]|uniref:Quinate repressor protein n=1 Tax=Cytospora mali TaxID=578113 RepID=A0A194V6Q6_CYTMA|nr:Quinate repressor protein [Valsa mali var. pyri (nom. inval.)]
MTPTTAGMKRSFATMATDMEDAQHEPVPSRQSPYANGSSGRIVSIHDSSPRMPGLSSARASRSAPGSPRPSPDFSSKRIFDPDASIVLTGIRGAGKSTLAIIASSAMKRKVVDAERTFQEATGLSSPVYKKTYGLADYHSRQSEVLQSFFPRFQRDTIIVCSWMERNVQAILRNISHTNPIIYVVRDIKTIQEYLKVPDDARLKDLLDASGLVFRRCSHFEFFNVSEDLMKKNKTESVDGLMTELDQRSPAPYLTLKRAERHFLKFLSLILPRGTIPFIESAFPLASIPTEDRRFTYAVSIPLSALLAKHVDIEDIETGADAIEIVVDDLVHSSSPKMIHGHLSPERAGEISRVLGDIRRNTIIPILYHVVLPGSAPHDEARRSLYLAYLRHGLRLAVEYMTVDLRLEDGYISNLAKGRTKLVANLQWTKSPAPSWKSPIWTSYYRKAQKLGCDLVRLTRPADHYPDNFEVARLHARIEDLGLPKLPLIAYNTGRKGRNSSCFNQVLTSVLPAGSAATNAGQDNEESYRQPCITALQATQGLYSSFVYDPMKLYVIGGHVSYSLSPSMHNAALKACGIPHVYRPHNTESIRSLQELVMDPNFAGASISLPFKVEIISITHSLSRHARAIGAVNTLIPIRSLNEDGTVPEDARLFHCRNRAGPIKALYGENTDWIGIRACIRRGLSPANAVRSNSCGLVIGAGGMARAAVYAMLQLGVKNICVFNRTYTNAENLVAHFTRLLARDDLPLFSPDIDVKTCFHILKSREDSWPEGWRQPTMIVSAIPSHGIGDIPAPDFTLPPQWLGSPTGGVIVEFTQNILHTPLLDQSHQESHRGWVTMDGLDLLPEQGFAQFELFTGRRAPRRFMRREVFRAYTDEQGQSNFAHLRPRFDNILEQEP